MPVASLAFMYTAVPTPIHVTLLYLLKVGRLCGSSIPIESTSILPSFFSLRLHIPPSGRAKKGTSFVRRDSLGSFGNRKHQGLIISLLQAHLV